ncbi:MAG TPA: two-component regulator propeller domain-containing protein, partial [Flavitalea sp.]|nr:two-component regulator propeller domain-containing protein [Flavitalea sp.]
MCSGLAIAQSYYFRHYQVENGLSHNTVFCTVQDSKGFLWFGTKDGLNRFDGYHFKVFHTNSNNGHDRDQISSLLIEAGGQLWVGTLKGLFLYDNQQEKLIPLIDTLTEIHNITSNGKGGLWFISRTTLYNYDLETKQLREFSPSRYFNASSICQTADGTLWVATNDGFLNRYDAISDRFSAFDMFSRIPTAASRWIVKIYPAGNNQIFVGTSSQGLKLFDVSSGSYEDVLTDNPDKTSVFVRDIAKYSDDEFWIGTESGIFILKMSTRKIVNLKKKYLDPYSISDNAIYALYKDMEGGVWAGTYFGGINYYPKRHAAFQKYFPDYKQNSIVGNVVREICEDQDGNLWLGTEDAGLNKLNPKTGEIRHFAPTGKKSDIAYSNIHGLLPIQDELLVGTFEHGLDIIDIHTGKVKKHYEAGSSNPDLKSNFIVTFLKTSAGSVWVGTSNGAYIFNPSSGRFTPSPIQSAGLFVSAFLEDHAGVIWMATHNGGVFAYDPATKSIRQFTAGGTENSISTNTINALFEDSRHHLWMATEGGGLCRLDENRTRFVNYSTKNGLPSNFVFKVLEDNQESLWITTSKGLVNMNPSTNGTTLYTKENGLLNDQFNYNSGYKDSKGRIYLGSLKGMISFDPAQFKSGSQFVSPLYFTGFQVNNQEMAIGNDSSALKKSIVFTDKITLPHDQSSF